MKIAIGCDHIVTDVKNVIIEFLKQNKHEVIDCGTYDHERTHYPIFGHKVATLVATNKVDRGIVLCGTGVGIANSANKVKGARCALVRDPLAARIAVTDFNANIIAFGGRLVGIGIIEKIVTDFLDSQYQGKNKDLIQEINQKIKKDNYQKEIFDGELEKYSKNKYHD